MKRTCALAMLLMISSTATAGLRYQWTDPFSAQEQVMLTDWVEQTAHGLEALSGPLPFDIRVRFQRANSGQEPVPWANTVRSPGQGVRFIVNPTFPLEQFLQDWTAPHELSHLLIPYLGRRHAWFAEGFASYMQYQVMYHMGVMDWPQVVDRYRRQMNKAQSNYDLHRIPFPAAASRLRAAGQYPTLYWGGAVLFLRLDSRLRQHGNQTLGTVIAGYVACCRMRTRELPSLVGALDEVSGTTVFSEELARFEAQPGFPEFEDALEGLAETKPVPQPSS